MIYYQINNVLEYLHEYYPEMNVDGVSQVDFALNRKIRFPFSKLKDIRANTLIYPNFNVANGTYKLLKEFYTADFIRPILMRLDKPAHVFQLGASVEEMVNMSAVAAIDAQQKAKRKTNKS